MKTSQLLQTRAKLLADIRRYFLNENILEVDVPVIGASGVTDPFLETLNIQVNGKEHYLQTSPEFFLKRLLAECPQDMYYLGKAFRADEVSRRHNPEFTMLEWYRMGMDDQQLIEDVLGLIKQLKPEVEIHKTTYRKIFQTHFEIDPHTATRDQLETIAKDTMDVQWHDEYKETWLDLLFSHVIEPNMPKGITVVSDYPESQCALAKIKTDSTGQKVAKRFEVFWNGLELANGYWELTDLAEQKKRFDADNEKRLSLGLSEKSIDTNFLRALEKGLPECAGVALGVDRLLMCLFEVKDIRDTVSFSFERL